MKRRMMCGLRCRGWLPALEGEDCEEAIVFARELEGGIEHVLERQVLSLQNLL